MLGRQYNIETMRLIFLLILLLLYPGPGHADNENALDHFLENIKREEKENPTHRYAPDFCDFEITFPEEPYTSRRCPDNTGGKCYRLTKYTLIYDVGTNLDMSASCVPSPANNNAHYNERVIRTILQGMARKMNIKTFSIRYEEKDIFRRGLLSGQKQTHKNTPHNYEVQIWIGPNSILTLEGSLVGQTNPEAKATFNQILNTAHLKKR